MSATMAAVDLGAQSGRVAVGRFDGERLDVEEVHRFPNEPVLVDGLLQWDVLGLYREGINQGRGFIALAALILGNWSPIGAAFSCLLFAWTEALTVFLRVDWINNAFIQSLPYIATLVVLALFSRRVRPPKAVGQAYEAGSPV